MNQTLSQRTVTCLYVAVFKLILVQFSYESVARVFLHGVYLSVIFDHLAVISGWLKWTVFGWSSPPLDPELQPPTGRWDFTYLLTYLFSSNKLYVCRRFSSHFNSCSSVAVFSPFVDDQSMRHCCYCCRKTRLECTFVCFSVPFYDGDSWLKTVRVRAGGFVLVCCPPPHCWQRTVCSVKYEDVS